MTDDDLSVRRHLVLVADDDPAIRASRWRT
jgi:hypothetical protein